MSLVEEVNSIAALIEGEFPDAAVYGLQGPLNASSGTFVIRLRQETRKNETRSHVMVERQYEVRFYWESVEHAVITMERLGRLLMNELLVIPAGNTGKLSRVESFSYEPSYEAVEGLVSCTGNMLTQLREERSKDIFEKINRIGMRLTSE